MTHISLLSAQSMKEKDMISISGEMAVYSSPVSCTQMLFSWCWRKRIGITMDRIKGGNEKFWMSFAFSAFLLLRVSPHKHLQAKASSREVLKRRCSVWYGALLHVRLVLKWFCQMRSKHWEHLQNWIFRGSTPLYRETACLEFTLSNNCRVCWEWRTEEWWMDFEVSTDVISQTDGWTDW